MLPSDVIFSGSATKRLKSWAAYLQEQDYGIRMEVASLRPDYLPTLSAAKIYKLSLLVKQHIMAS